MAAFLAPRRALRRRNWASEVAVLLARRRPGALHQHRLQPGRPLLHPRRAALAGALVEARHQARPGQKMPGGRELAHVERRSRQSAPRRRLVPRPGTSFNRSTASRKGASAASIRASKAAIVASSCSIVFRCWPSRKAVMVPDTAVERLDQRVPRAAETSAAEFGKPARHPSRRRSSP